MSKSSHGQRRRRRSWHERQRDRLRDTLGAVVWYAALPFVGLWNLLRGWRQAVGWLVWLVTLPFELVAGVIRRVSGRDEEQWQLNYGHLLAGAPAVVVLLLAVGSLLICAFRHKGGVEARYQRTGAEALINDQHSRAVVCYSRLVALQPDNDTYRFYLALAADRAGQTARARAIMQNLAPRAGQGFPLAHLWMAQQMIAEGLRGPGDLELAESHLARVLQVLPNSGDARAALGRLLAASGRYDKALAPLEQSVATHPELRLLLARSYAAQGDAARARLEAERAREYFEREVTRFPHLDQERLSWAEALTALGRYEDAERVLHEGRARGAAATFDGPLAQLYQQWLDILGHTAPRDPAGRQAVARRALALVEAKPEPSTDDLALLARLYVLLGEAERGEALLAERVEQSPELRLPLAKVYAASGRPLRAETEARAALRHFRRRLAEDGNNLALRVLAAEAALMTQDYAAAAELLGEAIARSPNPAFVRMQSAVYVAWSDAQAQYREVRTSPSPLELLERAIQIDPRNDTALMRLIVLARQDNEEGRHAQRLVVDAMQTGQPSATAYLGLGTAALQDGQIEDARYYLEQAVRLDPQSVAATNNLAWTLSHDEPLDLVRALDLVETALEREPANASLLDTRARVYLRLGRWKEALADLEACRVAMSGRPEYHAALAEVYEQLGRGAEAARAREHAALLQARAAPPAGPSPILARPRTVVPFVPPTGTGAVVAPGVGPPSGEAARALGPQPAAQP